MYAPSEPEAFSPHEQAMSAPAAGGHHVESLVAAYDKDGCAFPISPLDDAAVDALDRELTRLVDERPDTLAPEDLLNLHLTTRSVLDACRSPELIRIARRLLRTDDVSVFTSRILCKPPKTGKEIVWHQDSNYWPLVPPGGKDIAPRVASVWLALDDVDATNGGMDVLGFTAQPESRDRNVDEFVLDAGGDTSGFDNFNLSIDASKLNADKARGVHIRRGEAEWHSAYTIHRSSANRSDRRRLAFIVRYVPTGTTVRPGVRGSFDSDYPLVPVAGTGASDAVARPNALRYSPCFGNANAGNAALKK